MNVPALPFTIDFQGDASLGALLGALALHGQRRLVITYAGRVIRPGFHVTEVKVGSFATLDCGGNPDAWRETILQVEDLPASDKATAHMAVAKFVGILATVAGKVALPHDARLTFEVGQQDEAMRVFDVAELVVEAEQLVLRLTPRAAICKPRHRAMMAAAVAEPSSCCAPKAKCC